MVYKTDFYLNRPCANPNETNDFLHADNMLVYLLHDHPEYRDVVKSIEWSVDSNIIGKVVVISSKLSRDDIRIIGEWIKSQNIDGIGISFEQETFSDCHIRKTGDLEEVQKGEWELGNE